MDHPREKDYVLKRPPVLKIGTPWPTFAAHFLSFAGKHKDVLLELTKVDQEETERVKKALKREIRHGNKRAKGVLKRMKKRERKSEQILRRRSWPPSSRAPWTTEPPK